MDGYLLTNVGANSLESFCENALWKDGWSTGVSATTVAVLTSSAENTCSTHKEQCFKGILKSIF